MTLAIILFICSVGSYSVALVPMSGLAGALTAMPLTVRQEPAKPPESSQPQTPAGNSDSQTQGSSTPQAPPASPAPQAQPSSSQKQPVTKKRKDHKKKAAPAQQTAATSDCNKSDAANTAPAGTAVSASAPDAGTTAPSKCPPPKIVIREGGTSEPAIQLTGDADQAADSHQRATTDQLLGSVENNLKKIEGRQLNASQQEMVNQVQQFMQQSKAAVAVGDMQRGHTLALKAQLLSDELVKP